MRIASLAIVLERWAKDTLKIAEATTICWYVIR